jgi:predicted dithiol-disulfide oxidoreductase (DUF899 family)
MTTTESWRQLKSIALNDEHDRPPQLWPDGASDEYIDARGALLEVEFALRNQVHEVARLRRTLPQGVVMGEYALTEGPRDLDRDEPTQSVSLRGLFGDHDALVVYHLMFHPDDDQACPMCSLWVDGLHGISHHITRRAAFAVIGKAPIDKLRRWARHRGWQGLRVVSSYGTPFNTDLHVETSSGGQWPGISVYARDGDDVRHVLTQSARYPDGTAGGIDLVSPVWNAFDLLPDGRGEWLPDNDYPGERRGEANA